MRSRSGLGGVLLAAVLPFTMAAAQEVTIESPITGDNTILETPLGDTSTLPPLSLEEEAQTPESPFGEEAPVVESPFGLGDGPRGSLGLGPIAAEPKIEPAEIAEKGVKLRALDKISGELVDFELTPGQTKQLGRIQVTLSECRYPVDNPTGDAAAFLAIRNAGSEEAAFTGWMLASSPALNALDHPRYDVWVLNCITE